MRVAALLLLVLAIGFALGRLTAPDGRGRGGQRSALPVAEAPAPRSAAAGPEETTPPQVAPPEVEMALEVAVAHDDVALPTGPVDGADLEVDFEGFEGPGEAWVAVPTMTGGIEEQHQQAREAVAWFHLGPGTYEVWWFDAEGTRLGTRATIEYGKVTRVRAMDHRGAAPIPKGVGLLKLDAITSWGGQLGGECVGIQLGEGSAYSSVETDPRGEASALLAPGRYVVYLRDYESEVDVEEGRTTIHHIRHRREGDLVLVSDRECRVWIEPVGRDDDYGTLYVGDGDAVLPYLREGEYDIVLEELVSLGRIAVRAGCMTRFRCELPPGRIAVLVEMPGSEKPGTADVRIRREANGRATRRTVRAGEKLGLQLPAGRYVVVASAEECEPVSAQVDVTDRVTDVTLQLSEAR